VWTAKQLSAFLLGVVDDSLFAFWWLAALRWLRRGELCGLRWTAVDLDRGLLIVERKPHHRRLPGCRRRPDNRRRAPRRRPRQPHGRHPA
jgi:integrase